jgi:hypothetical protein
VPRPVAREHIARRIFRTPGEAYHPADMLMLVVRKEAQALRTTPLG